MNKKHWLVLALLPAMLLPACGGSNEGKSGGTTATAGNIDAAAIFSAKCAMCHDFKQDKIGPALSGVHERWQQDTLRLKQFIRNSAKMIREGDPYAKALYERWNQSAMPSFEALSDAEIDALVDYLK